MTPCSSFRRLQHGLVAAGLLFIATWCVNALESRRFQASASETFTAALREVESDGSSLVRSAAFAGPGAFVPPPPAPVVGEVLGRIEIPRLGITAIVAEGSDAKTLRHAIGHIPSTALPGRPGNCALAGHRDTFLRGLGGARVNDIIRVVTLAGAHTYQVEWSAVVEPHRVDVLDSTATRSLTLVTCYPFEFVGHAPQRYVVRARQVEAFAAQ